MRFPDQNLSICALANMGDVDLDGLCIQLADKTLAGLADRRAPSWAKTFREDALVMSAFGALVRRTDASGERTTK